MRRVVLFFMVIMVLLPTVLGARNLLEAGIGVSGVYDTHGANGGEDFFNGMGRGENWTIGIGLHTRLSVVNLSFLALLPNGSVGEREQDVLGLRSTISFDIPLVTNRLYVNLGGGLSTNLSYGNTETDSPARVNGRAVSSTSLGDAVTSSTMHMKFGLDFIIGSATVGMFYLVETLATLEGVMDRGEWSQLVRTSGQDRVGIQLQLALF